MSVAIGVVRHLRPALLVAVLLFGAIGPAAAIDGPNVTASAPADRDVNVSTALGQIVVEFDRPMNTKSYSVMIVDGATFPPLVKDGASWESPTKFVLRIEPLAPNTQYAFQLNSVQKTGFQTEEGGVALAPRLISFSTGGRAQGGARP